MPNISSGWNILFRGASFMSIIAMTTVVLAVVRQPVYSPEAKALPHLRSGRALSPLEDDMSAMLSSIEADCANSDYEMVPVRQ